MREKLSYQGKSGGVVPLSYQVLSRVHRVCVPGPVVRRHPPLGGGGGGEKALAALGLHDLTALAALPPGATGARHQPPENL